MDDHVADALSPLAPYSAALPCLAGRLGAQGQPAYGVIRIHDKEPTQYLVHTREAIFPKCHQRLPLRSSGKLSELRAVRRHILAWLLPTFCLFASGICAPGGPVGNESLRTTPELPGTEFLWIAPGTFTMGSPEAEPGHRPDESPQTEVTLSQGFWLGRILVTHVQWKRQMGTDVLQQARLALDDDTPYFIGRKEYIPLREFFGLKKGDDSGQLVGNQDDDLPMVWVSWNEATAFCRKLNAREKAAGRLPTGYEYRLPTEAEWEYACRAGTTGATYAGGMVLRPDGTAPVLDAISWYAGNSSQHYVGHTVGTAVWPDKKWHYPRSGPHPVATKDPNPWGLYDMLGNAAEWCVDWNGPHPGGHVIDPVGPSTGQYHVRKGGSWSSLATQTRAGYRNWHEPTYRWMNLGFRVALAPSL